LSRSLFVTIVLSISLLSFVFSVESVSATFTLQEGQCLFSFGGWGRNGCVDLKALDSLGYTGENNILDYCYHTRGDGDPDGDGPLETGGWRSTCTYVLSGGCKCTDIDPATQVDSPNYKIGYQWEFSEDTMNVYQPVFEMVSAGGYNTKMANNMLDLALVSKNVPTNTESIQCASPEIQGWIRGGANANTKEQCDTGLYWYDGGTYFSYLDWGHYDFRTWQPKNPPLGTLFYKGNWGEYAYSHGVTRGTYSPYGEYCLPYTYSHENKDYTIYTPVYSPPYSPVFVGIKEFNVEDARVAYSASLSNRLVRDPYNPDNLLCQTWVYSPCETELNKYSVEGRIASVDTSSSDPNYQDEYGSEYKPKTIIGSGGFSFSGKSGNIAIDTEVYGNVAKDYFLYEFGVRNPDWESDETGYYTPAPGKFPPYLACDTKIKELKKPFWNTYIFPVCGNKIVESGEKCDNGGRCQYGKWEWNEEKGYEYKNVLTETSCKLLSDCEKIYGYSGIADVSCVPVSDCKNCPSVSFFASRDSNVPFNLRINGISDSSDPLKLWNKDELYLFGDDSLGCKFSGGGEINYFEVIRLEKSGDGIEDVENLILTVNVEEKSSHIFTKGELTKIYEELAGKEDKRIICRTESNGNKIDSNPLILLFNMKDKDYYEAKEDRLVFITHNKDWKIPLEVSNVWKKNFYDLWCNEKIKEDEKGTGECNYPLLQYHVEKAKFPSDDFVKYCGQEQKRIHSELGYSVTSALKPKYYGINDCGCSGEFSRTSAQALRDFKKDYPKFKDKVTKQNGYTIFYNDNLALAGTENSIIYSPSIPASALANHFDCGEDPVASGAYVEKDFYVSPENEATFGASEFHNNLNTPIRDFISNTVYNSKLYYSIDSIEQSILDKMGIESEGYEIDIEKNKLWFLDQWANADLFIVVDRRAEYGTDSGEDTAIENGLLAKRLSYYYNAPIIFLDPLNYEDYKNLLKEKILFVIGGSLCPINGCYDEIKANGAVLSYDPSVGLYYDSVYGNGLTFDSPNSIQIYFDDLEKKKGDKLVLVNSKSIRTPEKYAEKESFAGKLVSANSVGGTIAPEIFAKILSVRSGPALSQHELDKLRKVVEKLNKEKVKTILNDKELTKDAVNLEVSEADKQISALMEKINLKINQNNQIASEIKYLVGLSFGSVQGNPKVITLLGTDNAFPNYNYLGGVNFNEDFRIQTGAEWYGDLNSNGFIGMSVDDEGNFVVSESEDALINVIYRNKLLEDQSVESAEVRLVFGDVK
ncbi:hypothetical protein J4408_00365, partial [Candidatus Pacearchaeota archaeon]|nr:hypothetical protein [Candidatus Pacearchaeota archaeon]